MLDITNIDLENSPFAFSDNDYYYTNGAAAPALGSAQLFSPTGSTSTTTTTPTTGGVRRPVSGTIRASAPAPTNMASLTPPVTQPTTPPAPSTPPATGGYRPRAGTIRTGIAAGARPMPFLNPFRNTISPPVTAIIAPPAAIIPPAGGYIMGGGGGGGVAAPDQTQQDNGTAESGEGKTGAGTSASLSEINPVVIGAIVGGVLGMIFKSENRISGGLIGAGIGGGVAFLFNKKSDSAPAPAKSDKDKNGAAE